MSGNAPCRPGCPHKRSVRALVCSVCWYHVPAKLRRLLHRGGPAQSKRATAREIIAWLRTHPQEARAHAS